MFVKFFLLIVSVIGRGTANPTSIYLLAGQSNMAGRGRIENGKAPPECLPNPAIFRFTANRTWEEAREPLHADIDITHRCGVGPGMPFTFTLLRLKPSPAETIGLVPCAIGGSPLSQWEKGGDLYVVLIERAVSATSGGGVIQALLWYQGETDAANFSTASSYRQRFEKFVSDVRADLSSPSLPVVQVALASPLAAKYLNMVREAQLGVRVPNVTCVDALGLQLESDKVHLTTASQVILGDKMARAFLSLQQH